MRGEQVGDGGVQHLRGRHGPKIAHAQPAVFAQAQIADASGEAKMTPQALSAADGREACTRRAPRRLERPVNQAVR